MSRRRGLLVDSHCHLNYLEAPAERLTAARRLGVQGFLCIGVDRAGIDDVMELADVNTDVWATAGQHPEASGSGTDPAWIADYLSRERVVAAGEMGLDYHHEADPDARRSQREAFEAQLGIAARHRLPVVVHTRAAEADTLQALRAHRGVTGVLHCFTESWDLAARALDLGYYVSISGIVTFRNADNVRDVARRVPDDRLLLETDSPWLAPVPHRGRPNEPAYVVDTASFVAELRGVAVDALAAATTENFRALFGVGP